MIPRRTYTVGVRRWTSGVEDAHGNPIEGHGAPEPVTVWAIAPTTSNEPEPGRNLVVTGYTLLGPPDLDIGPFDLVVIDGEDWKVSGEVGDWTRGPFNYAPGVSVNLTRAEGS